MIQANNQVGLYLSDIYVLIKEMGYLPQFLEKNKSLIDKMIEKTESLSKLDSSAKKEYMQTHFKI